MLHGLSLVAASGGYSLVSVCGLLIPVASFAVEHRLWVHGLQQLCYEGFDAPWHVESFQSRDRTQVHGLDLGSACKPGPASDSSQQSNLVPEHCSTHWESTHARSRGKPSVAGTLGALPTHTSDTCLQCSSLPTAQRNK